jgi:hypothetical protein
MNMDGILVLQKLTKARQVFFLLQIKMKHQMLPQDLGQLSLQQQNRMQNNEKCAV